MVELLTNETMLAAIIGAVLGAGMSFVLAVGTERRRQIRESRRSIVAELARVGHDYLATLEELQSAKEESSDGGSVRQCKAQLTRLNGTLIEIQIRLWTYFSQRRLRAAMTRLLNRCITVTEYLYDQKQPAQNADTAIKWLGTALEEVGLQAATAARLPLRDPARILWVGFRRVTPEDKRLLSFEDEPPPWQFAVSFDLIRKEQTEILQKVRSNMEGQARHLRCKLHNRAAHVVVHGKDIHHFHVQTEACCSEFGAIVVNALGLDPPKDLTE